MKIKITECGNVTGTCNCIFLCL